MKKLVLVVTLLAVAAPVSAQLGGVLRRAQQVKETKDKIDDLNFTEAEERQIGEDVSL